MTMLQFHTPQGTVERPLTLHDRVPQVEDIIQVPDGKEYEVKDVVYFYENGLHKTPSTIRVVAR